MLCTILFLVNMEKKGVITSYKFVQRTYYLGDCLIDLFLVHAWHDYPL
jgi:hypothetical protein